MADTERRRLQRLINAAIFAGLALVPIVVLAVLFWSNWGTVGRMIFVVATVADLAIMTVPLLMVRKIAAGPRKRPT